MNLNQAYNRLTKFLLKRGWQESTPTNRHSVFIPNNTQRFEQGYKLYVPRIVEAFGFEDRLITTVDIVADIYDTEESELLPLIFEGKEILNVRIMDKNIRKAKPSLVKMKTILERLESLLRDTANFQIQNDHHLLDKDTEEADRYLSMCNFSKNKEGSLITTIEVPGEQEIREANLFTSPIDGSAINKHLMSITSFINTNIIAETYQTPTAEFLKANTHLISVNVNESISNLYKSTDYCDVELKLVGVDTELLTATESVSKEKVEHIHKFNHLVRENLNEIKTMDIVGKVFELHSRDVQSDKSNNRVTMSVEVHGVKSEVNLYCSAVDYKHIAEAHRNNYEVKIMGAVLDKTQLKKYKVVSFREYEILKDHHSQRPSGITITPKST
jgi:hypothetical protein